VAILSSNIRETINYFTEHFMCSASNIASVEKPGFRLKSAMLAIGPDSGSFLQIIEPIEGPGVSELSKHGEGSLYEIALEVENIEEFYDQVAAKGLIPTDFLGRPISTKFLVASSGNKYFYLPVAQTRGTRIEIIQPFVS
jgi:hypothetical protein